jgi:hypothetical protein
MTCYSAFSKEFPMRDEEETRLRAAVTDCRRLSLVASYALTHVPRSVANNNGAYRKLGEADAIAKEQYLAGRLALKAYRTSKKLI